MTHLFQHRFSLARPSTLSRLAAFLGPHTTSVSVAYSRPYRGSAASKAAPRLPFSFLTALARRCPNLKHLELREEIYLLQMRPA